MMRHCFIDAGQEALPNWLTAFPELDLLAPGDLPNLSGAQMAWVRLRSGEAMTSLLAWPVFSSGLPLVLLADEPSDAVIMQAMEAGAAGCCNSRAAPEVLEQVALVVSHGGLWVGPSLLQRLIGTTGKALANLPQPSTVASWTAHLSEREQEVARVVAAGLSNKEIAERLHVTERTVKAHLTAIFEKMGVRDRLQLSLRVNGIES